MRKVLWLIILTVVVAALRAICPSCTATGGEQGGGRGGTMTITGGSYCLGCLNVLNFGASGSTNTYRGTCTATSNVITEVGVPNDFSVVAATGTLPGGSNGIIAEHCGATCLINGTACISVTPATPSVQVTGGSTGQTWCYKIAATDGAGGVTAAGSAGCTSVGNALNTYNPGISNPTKWNTISWSATTGAYDYIIYKQAGGAGAFNFFARTVGLSMQDSGQPNGTSRAFQAVMTCGYDVPCVAPTQAYNDRLLTYLVSGGGTASLTVHDNASTTFSGGADFPAAILLHDDSVAANACTTLAATSGSKQQTCYFPSHTGTTLLSYRMTQGFNITNYSQCVSILGDPDQTSFTADTGKYAWIDALGSGSCRLANIAANGLDDITPSRVGYIDGASTTNEVASLQNRIENSTIALYSDMNDHCATAVHGGATCIGTIGWFNLGSDLFSVNNSLLAADTPVLMYGISGGTKSGSTRTGGSYYGVTSAFTTLSTYSSEGIFSSGFHGDTWLDATGGPAILIQGIVRGLTFPLYTVGGSTPYGTPLPGGHNYAIEVGNSIQFGQLYTSQAVGRGEGFRQWLSLSGDAVGAPAASTATLDHNVFDVDQISTPGTALIVDTAQGTLAQHYITNNTLRLPGVGGSSSNSIPLLTIASSITKTVVEGNMGFVGPNETVNLANAYATGGNVWMLQDSYGGGTGVTECTSGKTCSADLVLGQGGAGMSPPTGGLTSMVNILSALGTCNATAEGGMATETNSTAACNAGATATSAGSTHCQVYCNGTNWIQTGF